MGKSFRAIWGGIVDAYGELFAVVGMNLLWMVFSIPFLAVGLFGAITWVGFLDVDADARQTLLTFFSVLYAVSLVIGPNPAAAGIHVWANRLARDERVEFSNFWEGLREYFLPSLKLWAIAQFGYFMLGVNALFYLRSTSTPLQVFGVVWLYGIYFWASMQLYQLPLLVEQEDKRIRLVLRNSFFLSLSNFLPSLILLVFFVFFTLASFAIALLIVSLTGAVVAIILARALQSLLERYRPAPEGSGSPASS